MGTIQGSINSALGSVGQMAAVGKGVKELEKSNTLAKANAEMAHIDAVQQIKGEYKEAEVPLKKAKAELKEAKAEYTEANEAFNDAAFYNERYFPPRYVSPEELEDLAGKATIAKARLNEAQEAKKIRQTEFNARKKALKEKLDVVNTKAGLFGIEPATLTGKPKGGKK